MKPRQEAEHFDSLKVVGPEYGHGTFEWIIETARLVGTGGTAPQRQDSLTDQLRDLQVVANRFGLYDAADWIGDYLGDRRS